MNRFACYCFLALLGLASLYIGVSGWVIADLEARLAEQQAGGGQVIYKGVEFADAASARAAAEKEKINDYFRWVYSVPSGLPLLLTSLAFGIIGGIANVVHKLAGTSDVAPRHMVCKPLFGGVIGLMIFGIATIMPAVIVTSAEGMRPLTVIFMCLFGGTFSNHVYNWVEEKTKMIFPLGEKTPTADTREGDTP